MAERAIEFGVAKPMTASFTAVGIAITVIGHCGCGNPAPLQAYMSSNAVDFLARCPRCSAMHRIDMVAFDRSRAAENIQTAVTSALPTIVVPQGPINGLKQ